MFRQKQGAFLKTVCLNLAKALMKQKQTYRTKLKPLFQNHIPNTYKWQSQNYSGHYCPLCNDPFETFYILFIHTVIVHPQQSLFFTIEPTIILIKQFGQTRTQKVTIRSKNQYKDLINHFLFLVSQRIILHSLKIINLQKSKPKNKATKFTQQVSFPNKISQRNLYHSTDPYRKVLSTQLVYESEQEYDQKQAQFKQDAQIKDFQDIGTRDKQIFVLWNNFIRKIKYPKLNYYRKFPQYPAPTIKDYKEYLHSFIEQHRKILQERLRVPFVLHLNTLLCHGFIDKFQMLLLITELR